MDNELSNSMHLTIELIVLSAVIGIIMLFAGIGQQFQRSTVTSVTEVVASAYGSEVAALREYEDVVPVATVYLVLDKNADVVQSVTGSIGGVPITSKKSLEGFFDRKVRVTVTETPQKMFIIAVGG